MNTHRSLRQQTEEINRQTDLIRIARQELEAELNGGSVIAATSPATYLDLLHSDGSLNRAVYEQILASRVISEINMRLCVSAGLKAPRLSLGEIHKWRAEQVALKGLGPISDAERARIVAQERGELNSIIGAMQAGAAKQREAMGAFAVAAE